MMTSAGVRDMYIFADLAVAVMVAEVNLVPAPRTNVKVGACGTGFDAFGGSFITVGKCRVIAS